jgi:hypothetical protein
VLSKTGWTIIGGPRRLSALDGSNKTHGWGYVIERAGNQRNITVILARASSSKNDLPPEVQAAIDTAGRSAVEQALNRDPPPRYLIISAAGARQPGL